MPKFLTQTREALREKYQEINRLEKTRLLDAYRNPGQSQWSYKTAVQERNRDQNRYTDVVPFDKNRVKLQGGGADYINASWIQLSVGDQPAKYISTQGPTARSWEYFWQMCNEQCTRQVVIVMLTPIFEAGREKCHKYWAEADFSVGRDLELEFLGQESHDGFSLTRWIMEDRIRQVRKPVYHYHYHDWADFSAPEQLSPMLELSEHVHAEQGTDPVIVHCSAGVGRSGTFIAVDYFLQHCTSSLADETDNLDRSDLITPENNNQVRDPVYEIVLQLRSQRVLMVQRFEQFVFIYDCIRKYYIDRFLSRK